MYCRRVTIIPKSETSLNQLLFDIRRIAEHRKVLTEKKIEAIYNSLMDDLDTFLAKGYKKYADENGRLYISYLDAQRKRAWFLNEIVKNVDSLEPSLRREINALINATYKECYQGMANAIKKADTAKKLASVTKDLNVRPEVLKQAVNNNISKLTLPAVLEKHRGELIYQIQQELNIGLMNGDRYETMAKRISERLNVSQSKAMNITRTETHRNIESGFMDCAENISSSVEGSEFIYAATWRTMLDERVRPQQRRKTKKGWKTTISKNGANHQKMEGATVKVGENFDLGSGDKTKAPSQSNVAAHDCNCRCFLEYNLLTAEEFAKATNQTVESVRKKYNMPGSETEKTGKENTAEVAKKSEKTAQKVELQLSDFPEAFTKGAEGKNTQKLIDYVNGIKGADPNALKLYSCMGKLENFSANDIPFKISHGKSHAVSYSYSTATHQLREVKINYPKLTGDNFAGQVNTTLHEQMHLLDMLGRKDVKKYNGWFSSQQQPLIDAFRSSTDSISDEIAELFKKHNAEHEAIRDGLEKKYKKLIADAREKYLPNGKASWEDFAAYKQYEKEVKKLRTAMEAERDYESRNIMGGGICNLQDIYDALSKGTYRANGTVAYGHGQRYYATEGNRIKETIANYASLSVTRPDLIDMLRKDKPELCAELDNLILELIKKAGV